VRAQAQGPAPKLPVLLPVPCTPAPLIPADPSTGLRPAPPPRAQRIDRAPAGAQLHPPTPPSRTNWTRLVPHPVLTGHVSSSLRARLHPTRALTRAAPRRRPSVDEGDEGDEGRGGAGTASPDTGRPASGSARPESGRWSDGTGELVQDGVPLGGITSTSEDVIQLGHDTLVQAGHAARRPAPLAPCALRLCRPGARSAARWGGSGAGC
jgi:hypothetical protein